MNQSKSSSGDRADVCSCNVIHQGAVDLARAGLMDSRLRADLADFYKIMGDATRISILNALLGSELCVCDICALLSMTQSAISHQLKTLRQARLVTSRREGNVVYYSLTDEHVAQILELGRVHLEE